MNVGFLVGGILLTTPLVGILGAGATVYLDQRWRRLCTDIYFFFTLAVFIMGFYIILWALALMAYAGFRLIAAGI